MLLPRLPPLSYNKNPTPNKIIILMKYLCGNIKINKEVNYAKLS